ncbi:DCN1-like protein 5 [Dimargaris xerosporica]|nr:DCN1-like protein 5 [Dimargaris xerosporica]
MGLYMKYEHPTEGHIAIEGIDRWCRDLGVDVNGMDYFILGWKLGAQSMVSITQDEFVNGLSRLECHSIKETRHSFPAWRAEIDSSVGTGAHKALYRWTFNFIKDPAQKSLDVDLAVMALPMLLSSNPHTQPFIHYLQQDSGISVINRDQWTSFYEFCHVIPADCTDYDELAAWPTLLDEYVRWRQQGHA